MTLSFVIHIHIALLLQYNIKSWFKPWVTSFTFQVFWGESTFKIELQIQLNWKFRIKINLPETNSFLSAQKAALKQFPSNVYSMYLGCITLQALMKVWKINLIYYRKKRIVKLAEMQKSTREFSNGLDLSKCHQKMHEWNSIT